MSRSGMNCATGCWLLAAGIGFIALVLMLVFGTIGWVGAFFLAGVVFVVLGLLFNWLFCSAAPSQRAGRSAESAEYGASRAAAPGAGTPSGAAVSTGAQAAAAPASEARTQAAADPVVPQPAAPDARKPEAPAETKPRKDGPAEAPAAAAEGTRPQALSAPRGGAADDLKLIKGVGPKLEQLLNSLGVYHYGQIAGWTVDEVAWVDANLKGFKGRVSRDKWIDQAKLLAEGGETEFSRRARDGEVY